MPLLRKLTIVREGGSFGVFQFTTRAVEEVGGDVCIQSASEAIWILGVEASAHGLAVKSIDHAPPPQRAHISLVDKLREDSHTLHAPPENWLTFYPFVEPRASMRQCFWAEPLPFWEPGGPRRDGARRSAPGRSPAVRGGTGPGGPRRNGARRSAPGRSPAVRAGTEPGGPRRDGARRSAPGRSPGVRGGTEPGGPRRNGARRSVMDAMPLNFG